MLRCVYADLDRTLLGAGGSFLRDADGAFTLLGARALEACERAGAELVVHAVAPAAEVAATARCSACAAGSPTTCSCSTGRRSPPTGSPTPSPATCARAAARATRRIAVGPEPGLEAVVGTLWIAGDALEDPLLRLELEERARVRTRRGGRARRGLRGGDHDARRAAGLARQPAEPDERERAAREQEDERAAGERHGDLALLGGATSSAVPMRL